MHAAVAVLAQRIQAAHPGANASNALLTPAAALLHHLCWEQKHGRVQDPAWHPSHAKQSPCMAKIAHACEMLVC